MFSLETTLLGVALALDAAIVTFAVGLLNIQLKNAHKYTRGALICGLFGFFQFLMLWLGSIAGYYISFSRFGYLFQLIVALIFIVMGAKVLQSSFKNEEVKVEWGFVSLILLAVATSIDALGAGISMGTLPKAFYIALEIGVITYFICGVAFIASHFLESIPQKLLLRAASVIFFILGGQILISYYL